jgi:hypothetical protein
VSQRSENLNDSATQEVLKAAYRENLEGKDRDPSPKPFLILAVGILMLVLGIFGVLKYSQKVFSNVSPLANSSDLNTTSDVDSMENSSVTSRSVPLDVDFINKLNAVGPDSWNLDPASPGAELARYNFLNAFMSENGCEVFVFSTPDDAQNGFDSHLIPYMYVWKGQDNLQGLGILVGRASIHSVGCLNQVWKVAH